MYKHTQTLKDTRTHIAHSTAKQRRKEGCWEPLNKKTFIEKSSWAVKQRGEVTWRRTGGNLRVTGGMTDTPMEQSHTYTFTCSFLTHTNLINTVKVLCAALKIAISLPPPLFADIIIIRMFCIHVLFPSAKSTRNPLCFIKGCACLDFLSWSTCMRVINDDVTWTLCKFRFSRVNLD